MGPSRKQSATAIDSADFAAALERHEHGRMSFLQV